MKTKSFSKFSFFYLLLAGLCCSLTLGCPPHGTDTTPPPAPKASFELINSNTKPYIMEGEPLGIALVMNLDDNQLSTYNFSITYEPAQLELDTNLSYQGITPVTDGTITSITSTQTDTETTLHVCGTQTSGLGPGERLLLFTMNWIARNRNDTGKTRIKIKADKLISSKNILFAATESKSITFNIRRPSYLLGGHVLDSIGGSPVTGAMVDLISTAGVLQQATTNDQGYFEFTTVFGAYDLVVSKSGRAGSRIEQVYVFSNKINWEIIQPRYSDRPEATVPPVISLTGLIREQEYNGLIPINISVQAGSCPVQATEFHASIYLKLGLTDMSYLQVASSNEQVLDYTLNTALYPTGPVNIKVVTYDINNNRSELNLPIIVAGGQGQVPSVAPTPDDYYIVANTYGKSLNILRSLLAHAPGSPDQSPAPSLLLPDTTVLVEFEIAKYYHGAAIYKSATRDGTFTLIGQTTDNQSGAYKFIDYAPTLEPGTTAFYKLAYFNQYGTGPLTAAIPVRILPKYNLSLVSPANHSAVTGSTATISWTCTPYLTDPGVQRTDWILMYNTLDATLVVYTFVVNQNQYTVGDLFYNNQYEWNVRSVYEYINSTVNNNVLSRSYPNGQGASDMSSNGAFYFTVKGP